METDEEFAAGPASQEAEQLVLRLDGFEGPIDLLLTLAREQKVDLTRISILALAEQYLAFVQAARELRLELAADYIVMAAWLAYLKSRLLLPKGTLDEEEPSGEDMAAALRFQLQRLEAMREAAGKLLARPRLGIDVLPRGSPEGVAVAERNVYTIGLYDLLSAYGSIKRRTRPARLRIETSVAWSIERALALLRAALGSVTDWARLDSLVPPVRRGATALERRSALAATFGASLELAKAGAVQLRQESSFGTIYLRPRAAEATASAAVQGSEA